MYLKSLQLTHFRKFDESDNVIEFVGPTRPTGSDDADSASETRPRAHVAADTTLIIGGNNSGKSTVVHALRMIVSPSPSVRPSDFCYPYLMRILEKACDGEAECPYIELRAKIAFDDDDSTANLGGLLALSHIIGPTQHCTEVAIRFSPTDEEGMLETVRAVAVHPREGRLEELLARMEGMKFVPAYLAEDGTKIARPNLTTLFSCSEVPATDVSGEHCLSDAFGKILRHQRDALLKNEADAKELMGHITEMNVILSKCIEALHGNDINNVLEEAVRGTDIKARIGSDITLDKIVRGLVRYEYEDGGMLIPEDQFGLGYTRLVMVIAHILDYVDQYDDDPLVGSVNLIIIEEPETHMHPQMQELFMQYIEDATAMLIQLRGKSLSCQLVITTHSDHIVHSKIHDGGRFDCINYLRKCGEVARAVPLSDGTVQPSGVEDARRSLLFLKRHVCLTVSSVFFADAVVIVEGQSEATLLPYYISTHEGLRDRCVSILSVGGAHGFVYERLMDAMGIPTAIITDLDIKRGNADQDQDDATEDHGQVTSLVGRTTTNATLKHFADTDQLDRMAFPLPSKGGAVRVFSQREASGFYPTSFEEALVLENFELDSFVDTLLDVRPRLFKAMLGDPQDRNALRTHSYECQLNLADKKGEFSAALLYELLTGGGEPPLVLPGYIDEALDDIASRTKGGSDAE